MTDLSIIIPCYNEAKRLPSNLEEILAYIHKKGINAEILIVDDGSTDNTKEVVNNYIQKNDNIKLISLEKNSGKGAAIKKGIRESSGEIILYLDADGSTPINSLDKIPYQDITDNQIFIGSRHLPESSIENSHSFTRKFISKVARLLENLLLGLKLTDIRCGFKIIKTGTAKKLVNEVGSDDFYFDTELMFRAKRKDIKIVEHSIKWTDKEGSKVSTTKDTVSNFVKLLNTFIRYRISNTKEWILCLLPVLFILILKFEEIYFFITFPIVTGWDGSGHEAIAYIYKNNIFPDIWGWTPNWLGGMYFPQFYTPVFFWITSLFGSLFPNEYFILVFKLCALLFFLLTPVIFFFLSKKLLENKWVAFLTTMIFVLLTLTTKHLSESGLTLESIIGKGFYAQQVSFFFGILWLYNFIDIDTRKTKFFWSAFFFALMLMSNVHMVFVFLSLALFLILSNLILKKDLYLLKNQILSVFFSGLIALIWYGPMLLLYQEVTTKPIGFYFPKIFWVWFYIFIALGIGLFIFIKRKQYILVGLIAGIVFPFILSIDKVQETFSFIPTHIDRWVSPFIFISLIPLSYMIILLVKKTDDIKLKFLIVIVFVFPFFCYYLINKEVEREGIYQSVVQDGGLEIIDYFKNKNPDSKERYLVEPSFKKNEPAGSLVEAIIGRFGHEGGPFILRESSNNILYMVPIRNSLSSQLESWAYDSKLIYDMQYLRKPLSYALEEAAKMGFTKFITKDFNTQYLLSKYDIKNETVHGEWKIYPIKNASPKVELIDKPILLYSTINYKERDSKIMDWTSFQEGILKSGRLDIVYVNTKEKYVDDLFFDESKFSELIISEPKYKDLNKAISKIEGLLYKTKIKVYYSEYMSEDSFIKKISDINNKNLELIYYSDSLEASTRLASNIQKKESFVDQNPEIIIEKDTLKIKMADSTNLKPILIRYSYLPTMQRDDNSPVYLASPGFTLTFATSSFSINIRKPKEMVLIYIISVLGLICAVIYPIFNYKK